MLDGAPSAIGGPKARGAKDDILLENDRRARGAGRARRIRQGLGADRRCDHRSRAARRTATGRPDQRASTRRPVCSRATPSTTRATPSRSIGGHGRPGAYAAVVFRGHLEGEPAGHGRHPLRAARLRARRPRSHRPLQRRRANRTRCTSPTGCSGATTTPGAVRARRRGSASARPSWTCATSASAWREWPFVAARSQAPPDVSYAVVPCDRPTAAGFNNPTLTASGVPLDDDAAGRRHPSRALHPRRAGPGPRAGGRRGAARPRDGSRRSARR